MASQNFALKINLAIGFIRRKPAGMHWLAIGYNDAVSWLNEAKTRIFQPTANFEIFEIYLYLGMGDTCKFHSIRFQVLSTKYRNHFDTILSTFDYHGYLLQIYQQLPEYDLVCGCTLLLNPFCLITSK